MSLRPKQKLFIQYYTDTRSEGFGNGAKAYAMAGYKSTDPRHEACKLLQKPQVKATIATILDGITRISKEDYIAEVQREIDNCKTPAVRARLLELKGKVHNFLKDNEIHHTSVIFNDAQRQFIERTNEVITQRQSTHCNT